jgi:hypothetical protein
MTVVELGAIKRGDDPAAMLAHALAHAREKQATGVVIGMVVDGEERWWLSACPCAGLLGALHVLADIISAELRA